MKLCISIIALTLFIFTSRTVVAQEAIPAAEVAVSNTSQGDLQLKRPSTTPFVVGAITASVGVVAGTALLIKGLTGPSTSSCIDFCPVDDNTSIIGGAILV